MTNSITGQALTNDASRIIRRLCKHWSHKLAVQVDDTGGVIEFPDAKVTLRALPDRVDATIVSANPATLARLPGVLAEHLARMAGPEATFEMVWAKPTLP